MDTHGETHHAAVIDALGRQLADPEFPTTPRGYRALLAWLELFIRDDGSGGADPTRGSGLIGLSDLVDALGGTIEVASPVGRGTTLLITLPLEEG